MFDRRAFPQRRPSAFGPELGAQFLLERLILADSQRPALPEFGRSALRSLGTHVTGTGWKLDGAAKAHRHGLAARTPDHPVGEIEGEVVLGKKRPTAGPGTGDNVDPLLRPLPSPWTGHVSQVNVELQQPWGFLQLGGQQVYGLMLGLIGRTHHHLADGFAV